MHDRTHLATRRQPPDDHLSHHNRKRLLYAGFATVLAAGLLAACDDDNFPDVEPAPSAAGHGVLIVATATANEPAPQLPDGVAAQLRALADRFEDAEAIVVGPHGKPQPVVVSPHRADGRPEHGSARPALIEQNVRHVQAALTTLASDENELDLVDLLGAAVRAYPQITDVVVVSSGVTTAGGIDVRASGWNADPRQVVQFAAQHEALPDLAGHAVTFAGLGVVSGAQPQLLEPQRHRLGSYWLQACRAAGAKACTVISGPATGTPSASKAHVPVVPVEQVPVQLPPVASPARPAQVTLPDAFFEFDSARLAPGAVDQLRDVAGAIRARELRVAVVGHSDDVPGPTPDYNLDLSRRRAQAVADALVELGVPASAITHVDGVGARENPQAPKSLDPAAEGALRKVVITAVTR